MYLALFLLVCISVYIYCIYIQIDGFENIYTSIPDGKTMLNTCPSNNVMVHQVIKGGNTSKEGVFNIACYPEGLTNVSNVFQGENLFVSVTAPKGSTAIFYSGKDGTGSVLTTLSDATTTSNAMCPPGVNCFGGPNTAKNFKFSSIKVIIQGSSKPSTDNVMKSCPGLSPAAAAAATAADASVAIDKAKAADIAKVASQILSDNITPQVLSNNGINISCPTGDPIITNARNTKFANSKPTPSCNNYTFESYD
jgi:hypothetical protein